MYSIIFNNSLVKQPMKLSYSLTICSPINISLEKDVKMVQNTKYKNPSKSPEMLCTPSKFVRTSMGNLRRVGIPVRHGWFL